MTGHLTAHGLSKTYWKGKNEVPVLRGVDLEVERGEMVAVVGASGSGKSTLLHILGLLDGPDSGMVVLDGKRIDNESGPRARPAAERHVRVHLPVLSPAARADRARERADAAVDPAWTLVVLDETAGGCSEEGTELLERVGLGHRSTHRPAELSGGEMQRAAIARALAGRPAVLLADEPTGNLDAGNGQGVLDLLRDLNRERGLTMILVTHDQHIAQQADRVVRLAEGRIEEWSPALA